MGHADSAHSLNHQRRLKATHKEGFTGHDAVMSWLEKADDPSPDDDDVAPVRKVCYTAISSCMMKLAPHTPMFPALPTCLLQVESSGCQHITACHALSSASQMEAAFRYYERITSAAVQRAKEDQRRRFATEGRGSPTEPPCC